MQTLLLANPTFGANYEGIFLFGFQVYYYAICIVIGMLVAAFLSALLMKRRNMSVDFIFTLFIFCIPSALICARLFYCITSGMHISQWIYVREGGLSVIGGVIGGVGAGLIVCLVKKVDFFRAADCVVTNIFVGQIFGRWGNFFNKEVYGGVVASKSMQWFPFAVPVSPFSSVKGIASFSDPSATWHYAFFFYEIVFNLIGFAILFSLAWNWKKKPNGLFTFGYFVWYGIVRTVMEPLRDPSYILDGGGVPWSLVFSVLMIVGGLVGIGVLLYFNYRKEGALIGSKTGDPCGITQYLSPDKDEVPYFSKINMLGDKYPVRPVKGQGDSSTSLRSAQNDAEGDGDKYPVRPVKGQRDSSTSLRSAQNDAGGNGDKYPVRPEKGAPSAPPKGEEGAKEDRSTYRLKPLRGEKREGEDKEDRS